MGGDKNTLLTILWRSIVRGGAGGTLAGISKFVGLLLDGIATILSGAVVENAFPLVGAIFNSIAALGIVAEMTETGVELGLSPWTYLHDITLPHDLSVAIK